jgi:hypothetical protein
MRNQYFADERDYLKYDLLQEPTVQGLLYNVWKSYAKQQDLYFFNSSTEEVRESDYIKYLNHYSMKFRTAIINCDPNILPVNLRNFPAGACGDASLLLGEYLKLKGFSPLEYVVGFRGEQSHAWLELGGILIDITADQFESIEEAVIVTNDKSWYKQFKQFSRSSTNIKLKYKNERETLERLLDAYRNIVACL